MASIRKQTHTNDAVEVIKLSNDGSIIGAACREFGNSRSTFYRVCESNADVKVDFQELELTHVSEQVVTFLQDKTKFVERMSEDTVSGNFKPRKRLKIIQYMDKRIEGRSIIKSLIILVPVKKKSRYCSPAQY